MFDRLLSIACDTISVNKLLIELLGPPLVTSVGWVISRLMARRQRDLQPMSGSQFYLLLISAYFVFAMALWGGPLFSGHSSSQLVQ